MNSLVNTLVNFIVNLIMVVIRHVIEIPAKFIKRNFKKVLIGYLIGMPFGNVLNAQLFSPANITENPMSVVQTVKNGGVANFLTWGTLKPAVNGGTYAVGEVQKKLSDITGNDELFEKGIEKVNEAKSWFGDDNVEVATVDDYEIDEDFSYNKYPEYYKSLGLSDIDPEKMPKAGEYKYAELDKLGRTGTAKATIRYEDANTGCREINGKEAEECKRQSFSSSVKPSGWLGNNREVSIPGKDGRVYNGWFYNKSHLIGDSLGGDPITENVITGTRPQNVGNVDNKGGMRYTEIIAENYLSDSKLKGTDKVLYYQAKPVYVGDELVPRYVIVDIMSSDKKVNEKVQVFNNANGWEVDYMTGEFRAKSN